jgi:phosphomannomutase
MPSDAQREHSVRFGTSGLRGLATDLTDATCAAHAAAFLAHLGVSEGAALIGRDLRPSSPRIAAACVEAVRAAGLDAVDCGILPTPALALEAARRGAPAIMVTGSHIPFDRNGLKFYRPDGEITKADETGILAALGRARGARRRGAALRDPGAAERYRDRAMRAFPSGCLAGLRIGVLQHSAAGRDLMLEILSALGAEVLPFDRTDDFLPVDTEAIRSQDAARIRTRTLADRFDAVVSTDGDGDRPLLADETGTILRGDALGLLAARRLGADAVSTPVTSSTALEQSGWFARIVRTRIGSPHVIVGMLELAAAGARLPVGYEANGGFMLGAPATPPGGAALRALPTRDAMLPMLAALTMANDAELPLSNLATRLPARATASDRLTDIPPERSRALLDRLPTDGSLRDALLAAIGGPAVEAMDCVDGIRLRLAGDEIVHLRASGNAPELRCYAEAAEPARAERIVRDLSNAVARQFAEERG